MIGGAPPGIEEVSAGHRKVQVALRLVAGRQRARCKIDGGLLVAAERDAARGAAGWRGRSRAVCGGVAHVSVLGQWRTEPEVSNWPRMLAGQDAILAGAPAKVANFAL